MLCGKTGLSNCLINGTDLKIWKMVLQSLIDRAVHFVHQATGYLEDSRRMYQNPLGYTCTKLYMYHLGDGQCDIALFPHFHTFEH